jgi:hypothetical protein
LQASVDAWTEGTKKKQKKGATDACAWLSFMVVWHVAHDLEDDACPTVLSSFLCPPTSRFKVQGLPHLLRRRANPDLLQLSSLHPKDDELITDRPCCALLRKTGAAKSLPNFHDSSASSQCRADRLLAAHTRTVFRAGQELVESKVGTAETEMDEGEPAAVTARDLETDLEQLAAPDVMDKM